MSDDLWPSSDADAARKAHLHVHVALASILVTVLAPLVGWVLVWRNRRSRSSPWRRRLIGIAVLDTVLVIASASAAAFGVEVDRAIVDDVPEDRAAEVARETSRPSAPPSLFEPIERVAPGSRDDELGPRSVLAGSGVLSVVFVGALAVAARRRRTTAVPGAIVVVGLLALTFVSSAVLLAFAVSRGISLGALLLAMLAGSFALLVTGLAAMPLTKRESVRSGPSTKTTKAIGLGILYGLAGAARIAVIAALVAAISGLPLYDARAAFDVDRSLGPLGIGIFVLATVIVAPIGEELLFRGVLLPWLARFMSPASALACSTIAFAIGHLYYGLGVLLILHYGVVFGWARLRTGKLWAPIVLHALLNGVTAAALFAADA